MLMTDGSADDPGAERTPETTDRQAQSESIVRAVELLFNALDSVADDPVALDVVHRCIINRYRLSPERAMREANRPGVQR